jgi:predicted amidohydrolase YtcJ
MPRFHELGVVACMQPRHAMPGGIGQWVKAVGPERVQRALPWRSLHDAGAVLAFSSDWDVTEMDPIIGIYTAVTRKSLDGNPPGGWIPEQTVSLETAIRAYTLNGAYANFAEQNRGSITVGKYADLVLLSANLFEIPHQEILDTKVVLTMVGGSVVYRAP